MKHWLLRLTKREPDLLIHRNGQPTYLRRWYAIPRNPVFNIYLHEFLQSDFGDAMHDHPWLFNLSWVLRGNYFEHKPSGPRARVEGDVVLRWGKSRHWIELIDYGTGLMPVITLFITGPRIRKWGFYCPTGWVQSDKFLKRLDNGGGCGD